MARTTELKGEDTDTIPAEAVSVVVDPDGRTGETGIEAKDADAVTDVDLNTGRTTRRDPVSTVI